MIVNPRGIQVELTTPQFIKIHLIMGTLFAPVVLCVIFLVNTFILRQKYGSFKEVAVGVLIGYLTYFFLNIFINHKNRKVVTLLWLRYIHPIKRIPLFINHKDPDIVKAVKERLGREREDITRK